MACVEAALKSSVRKELAVKSTPQAAGFLDDLWAVQNGTDDFSVDELLDFSNEEDLVAAEEEEEAGIILDLPPTASVSPKVEETKRLHGGDFGPVPAGELAVPVCFVFFVFPERFSRFSPFLCVSSVWVSVQFNGD